MPAFMFFSGAFSSHEITSEALRKNFVMLLVPCFIFDTWRSFILTRSVTEWFTEEQLDHAFDVGKPDFLAIGLWYLKALFILRIALVATGNLNTLALSISTFFVYCTYIVWLDGKGYNDQTVFYKSLEMCPFYFAGYLCKRHKILESYQSLLRTRPSIRVLAFCIAISLWLLALLSGKLLHEDWCPWWLQHPSWEESFRKPVYKLPNRLWCAAWKFAYTWVWSSWIPLDRIPGVGESGARTLAAYIFNTEAQWIIQVSALKLYEVGLTGNACWSFLVLSPLAVLFAFTTEAFSYAFWPLITPTWCSKWIVGKEMPPNACFKEYGWKPWLAAFLVGSAAFSLANTLNDDYLVFYTHEHINPFANEDCKQWWGKWTKP
ncbi:hypothetical protein CYMTET_49903 [Cymbomonas tetramitiformis]|uniref:Uncharacterized protein n=1 Tax=Cymbomonas tetramitiformis TaxID=36881 RepID=A0AAE0ETP3_9CHLO|nr:hypothetical protein CYMTET_49903 [Cymbomonas tetramitiformis]